MVGSVKRLAKHIREFLEILAFVGDIGIEVYALLVHAPGILVRRVGHHHGVVKTDGIVHAALPCGRLQSAVDRTILTHSVAVVVALLKPPL